jgi:hypothetical protein
MLQLQHGSHIFELTFNIQKQLFFTLFLFGFLTGRQTGLGHSAVWIICNGLRLSALIFRHVEVRFV